MSEKVNGGEFEVVIENGPYVRRFTDPDKLIEWATAEWNAFGAYASRTEPYRTTFASMWQPIQQALNELPRTHQRGSVVEQLSGRLNDFARKLPLSDTPEGKLLAGLVTQSKRTASAAWQYLYGFDIEHIQTADGMRGVLAAEAFRRGDSTADDSIRKSIQERLGRVDQWLIESQDKLSLRLDSIHDWETKAESTRVRVRKWRKAVRSRVRQQLAAQLLASKQQHDSAATNLASLIQTYDQKLALQWPSEYWQRREVAHTRWSILFGVSFALAVAASVVLIAILSVVLVLPVEHGLLGLIGVHLTDASPLPKISAFAALMAIVYWVLRLLAKNMLSHQHRSADAAERRILILTYLALQRSGKLSESDLQLIMPAVFRVAADGLVRDDPGPTHPLFEVLRQQR